MKANCAALLLLAVVAAAAGRAAANPQSAAAAIAQAAAGKLGSLPGRELTKLNDLLGAYPDIRKMLGPGFAGTIFAPSDAAFAAAEDAGIAMSNDILMYHVVAGPPAPVTALNDDQIYTTAQTGTLQVQYNNGAMTIIGAGSNASIVSGDIMIGPAEYAVVHVIDNVLLPFVPTTPLPPVVQGSKPAGTVGAASLSPDPESSPAEEESPAAPPAADGDISPELSPEDEEVSPAETPEGQPEEEVSPAETPEGQPEDEEESPAEVSPEEESPAEPPTAPEEEQSPAEVSPELPEESLTVIDVAIDANLTALVAAIEAAGIVDLFGPEFNGTVFAPTNEAAGAFLAGSGLELDNLTPEQLDALISVLSYHVVPSAAVFSADLEGGAEVKTLNGQTLKVSLSDGKAFLETTSGQKVEIVKVDVEAGPAVVHVVDAVLVPQAAEAPTPAPAPAPPSAASSALASIAALAGSLLAALVML